jgi:SAM-dependent methyltransferase
MNTERVRNDFDQIARLSDCHRSGENRYDSFLVSMVPKDAMSVLDVGCGLERLSVKLAIPNREGTGVDLSPEMIARAREEGRGAQHLKFLCGDFLARNHTAQQFDCVISAAALHRVIPSFGTSHARSNKFQTHERK